MVSLSKEDRSGLSIVSVPEVDEDEVEVGSCMPPSPSKLSCCSLLLLLGSQSSSSSSSS